MNDKFNAQLLIFDKKGDTVCERTVVVEIGDLEQELIEIAFDEERCRRAYLKFSLPALVRAAMSEKGD